MPEHIWEELKVKLPFEDTPEAEAARNKYWGLIDVNSNGYLSLAEIDKGLRDVIQIPTLFDLKPVIIRSFNAAKKALKAKSSHGDDYVSKAEFKYLLRSLRQHYEYWVAFDKIDITKDRRVSLKEFQAIVPVLNRWGIKISDPALGFKEIDTNHGGFILFDEFCAWAIKKNLDIDEDDNLV